MTLQNIIKNGSLFLKNKKIKTHLLDSEIILANIMGISREYLLTNEKEKISKSLYGKFRQAIIKRSQNEPVAYINKKKEFWSINFFVNKSTLIPRPETELLINETLKFVEDKKINVLDIGTGSGCILLSFLTELKKAKGVGIDVSSEAIEIAKKNSRMLNLSKRSNFYVFNVDKLDQGNYDLVISNPPYVCTKDIKNLDEQIVKYEPLVALNGGIDGLDVIRKIVRKSREILKRNGILAIEVGNGQYSSVSEILELNNFQELSRVVDFEENVRCIISTRK